jgi:tRNA-dihydrouridine synthase B
MRIGSFALPAPLCLAPMAGVTDRPFRQLCRRLGAGHVVGEMVTSRPELRDSRKTLTRLDHRGESAPIAVQIVGTEPAEMADAARFNIDRGAQIIDINMGCPAKKVCSQWAGSALMQDEPLALSIVEAVVAACAPHGVPVTLKMRTGWSASARNAVSLARGAESAGVAMVAVHGRTREQAYRGAAEHETVAAVKAALHIPVVANGDIVSPARARAVLQTSGADAVMIGRGAMGRPWLFAAIRHELLTGTPMPQPDTLQVHAWLHEQLIEHHALYGEWAGVRSARKHIGWTVADLPGGEALRQRINLLETALAQLEVLADWFQALAQQHPQLPWTWPEPDVPNPSSEELQPTRHALAA